MKQRLAGGSIQEIIVAEARLLADMQRAGPEIECSPLLLILSHEQARDAAVEGCRYDRAHVVGCSASSCTGSVTCSGLFPQPLEVWNHDRICLFAQYLRIFSIGVSTYFLAQEIRIGVGLA